MDKIKLISTLSALSLVLAGCGHAVTQPSTTESPTPAESEAVHETEVMEEDGTHSAIMEKANTVIYTDDGFSPKTMTVSKGTEATFVNESSKSMWVASSVHPTHKDLPGFDQRQAIGHGQSYSFTFDQVGEWNYHNHVGPADIGTIIVE